MTKHYESHHDDEAMLRKRRVWRLSHQLENITRLSSQLTAEEVAANTSAEQADSAKRDSQKLASLQLAEIKEIFNDPSLLDDLLEEIYTTWFVSKQHKNKLADKLISHLKQALASSSIQGEIAKLLNEETFNSQLEAFKRYVPFLKHLALLEEVLRFVEAAEITQQLEPTEIIKRKQQVRDFCIQQYYAEQQRQIEKLITKRKRNKKITIALSCLVALLAAGTAFYGFFMPGILVVAPLSQLIIICTVAAVVMLSVAVMAGSAFYQAVKMFVPFTVPAFYQQANLIAPLQLPAQSNQKPGDIVIKSVKQALKQTAKLIAQGSHPATPKQRRQQEAEARFSQLLGEKLESTGLDNKAEDKLEEAKQLAPTASKKSFFKANGKLRKVLSKDGQHNHGTIWQKVRYGIYQQALNHIQQKAAHDDKWRQLANDWLSNKQDEAKNVIKPSLIVKYCADIPCHELPPISELKHVNYPRT